MIKFILWYSYSTGNSEERLRSVFVKIQIEEISLSISILYLSIYEWQAKPFLTLFFSLWLELAPTVPTSLLKVMLLGDKSYFKPYKVGQWHIVYSTLYYLPKVSFFWDTSQGMSIFKESSHQKQPSNCGRPHRLANQRPFFWRETTHFWPVYLELF